LAFWIATLEVDINVSEEYVAPIFRVEVSVVRIRSELARKIVTQIHGSERGDSPVQANILRPWRSTRHVPRKYWYPPMLLLAVTTQTHTTHFDSEDGDRMLK
jgi:hypothetical protein